MGLFKRNKKTDPDATPRSMPPSCDLWTSESPPSCFWCQTIWASDRAMPSTASSRLRSICNRTQFFGLSWMLTNKEAWVHYFKGDDPRNM